MSNRIYTRIPVGIQEFVSLFPAKSHTSRRDTGTSFRRYRRSKPRTSWHGSVSHQQDYEQFRLVHFPANKTTARSGRSPLIKVLETASFSFCDLGTAKPFFAPRYQTSRRK